MTSVLLIGFGAIGRHLTRLLSPERAGGRLELTALVNDASKHTEHLDLGARVVELRGLPGPGPIEESATGISASPREHSAQDDTVDPRFIELLNRTHIVVECAGVSAAGQLGPAVIAAGRPLVLTSVGALADPQARGALLAGPGALHVTNGAIGGLDVLEAVAQADALDSVAITTSKEATGLIRPWMSPTEAQRLRDLDPAESPIEVFAGTPVEAIAKFPANVNIAVALAWATRGSGSDPNDGRDPSSADERDPSSAEATDDDALMQEALQRVQVRIEATAGQSESAHRITASGAAGDFAFDIRSTPSPENPATSGLTALSVARTLRQVLALRRDR